MTRSLQISILAIILLAPTARLAVAVEGDEHWSSTFALPGADHVVYASLRFADDLIIAGDFLHVGTCAAHRVARWDGSSWQAIGEGFDGTVRALAEFNDELYAAGDFEHSGTTTVQGVARWDGQSWQALPEQIDFLSIHCLAVFDGALIAGGIADYGIFEGEWYEAAGLAAWDGTSWTQMADFELYMWSCIEDAVVFQEDLIIGGSFEELDGNWECVGVARWDGQIWQTMGWRPFTGALVMHEGLLYAGAYVAAGIYALFQWDRFDWIQVPGYIAGGISCLRSTAEGIIVGGSFGSAGGVPASSIALWGDLGWSSIGEPIDYAGSTYIETLVEDSGLLLAGGGFRHVGNRAAFNLAGWDGSSWQPLFNPADEQYFHGLDSESSALACFGGSLAVSGRFGYGYDTWLNGVGLWDGESWNALGTGLQGSDRVWTLIEYQESLVIAGNFTKVGGVTSPHMALWTGSAWQAFGGGLAPEGRALLASGANLYVGGDFAAAGGLPAENIACWDGAAWSDLDGGLNDRVYALLMLDGDLLAAGGFTADTDGTPLNRIARWDGSAWSAMSQGFNEAVYDLVLWNGALIAGGYFNQADGAPTPYLATWDGAAWQPFPSGPNGYVTGLAVYNGELVACGRFSELGGIPASCIGRWDGTNWSPLGSGLDLSNWGVGMYMRDLQVLDDQLYVAGSFRNAGGRASYGIACWSEDLTAVPGDEQAARPFGVWNYPNPFNPSTEIVFTLPAAAPVTLRIVDANGRLVRTLLAGVQFAAGEQRVAWDGRDDAGRRLASGAYLYELEAGGRRAGSKMLLLK